MARTAEQFISELAQGGLVPDAVLQSLRRQVAQAAKPVSPAAIAKALVQHGHLTEAQAKRLLGARPSAAPAPRPGGDTSAAPSSSTASLSGDLGLTPLEELAPLAPLSPLSPLPIDKPVAPQGASLLTPLEPLAPELAGLVPLDAPPGVTGRQQSPPRPARPIPPMQPPKPTQKPLPPIQAAPPKPAAPLKPLSPPAPIDPTRSPLVELPAGPASTGMAQAPSAGVPLAAGRPRRWGMWIAAALVGVLAAALAIGGMIALVIPRGDPDAHFQAAEQEFTAGNYAAAAAKYEELLKEYPRHERAGPARVRCGLARMLAAAASNPRWPEVYGLVRDTLPEIDGEPELGQVRGLLAPLLVDLAGGLAESVQTSKTPSDAAARLAEAKAALALARDGHYVPADLRPWQRLDEIEESLAIAQRMVERDERLQRAAAAVTKAVEEGRLDAAYAARRELLMVYPELAAESRLQDLGRKLAEVEKARVKPADPPRQPHAGPRNSPVAGSVVLVGTQSESATVGEPVFVADGGMAYALDSGCGKLLWRFPLGVAAACQPVRMVEGNSVDALLFDAQVNELIRIDGRSGHVRWRLDTGGPLAGPPVIAGLRIVCTTRSGLLLSIEPATGKALAAAQLPLPAGAAPIAQGEIIYQLAAHLHLFVLSAEQLECKSALYVGHEREGVAVPPVVFSRLLVVADNHGASAAVLRVFPLDEKAQPGQVVQELPVSGNVVTPPVVLGRRLVVLTDAGRASVFSTDDAESRLAPQGEVPLESPGQMARFGAAAGDQLWVADVGLRRYLLSGARGELTKRWGGFEEAVFEAPPQLIGQVAVLLRRTPGQAGVTAFAVDAASHKLLWQSTLGVPLAGAPVLDSSGTSVSVVSSLGSAVEIPLTQLEGTQVREVPVLADGNPPTTPLIAALALRGGGRVLVPAGQPRLLVVDAPQTPRRELVLPGALAGMPIAAADGILAATTTGSVFYLDVADGRAGAAYQLPMRIGSRLTRCYATTADEAGRQFVVCEGGGRIVHLELTPEPMPQLKELAAILLDAPIAAAPCVVGQTVYVADGSNRLHAFDLPGLNPARSWPLGSRAVVGPAPVGQGAVVATANEELLFFDNSQEPRWKVSLPHGPLAGAPVAVAGDVLIATRSGWLIRLAGDSGQELARVDVGQAVAGLPVVAGQFGLLAAADGTLLKVALPAKESQP
jgi:outer membrane protein assembly factor BamB